MEKELTPYDMQLELISIGYDEELLETYSSRHIVELYNEEFDEHYDYDKMKV